ncbi:PREDICTED: sodium channel and clathrin linker 1 isoform X3 [Myotis brandtii]|uniref:sodium channel and clathrin linker 1 isoform X3 n=1 Tax=Myotis brandtii TaxID=109478 RepID=UPI000703FCCD|nr:PREDICTED: sodium channel and clathrin linker 1 isoform X3 [Myotis brandtii]
MAAEMDPLREKTQRLNEVLRQCQMENVSKYSTMQKAAFKGEGGDILGNSVVDQSFSAPLITEYDKHLEELNGQVKYYQKQVGEMKLQLESVIKENERLHSELKDAVVKQLEALPFGTEMGNDIYIDDETVRNLQEQLQLANKEKNYVLELWQNVSQELDKVKKIYQENKAQIQVIEGRKQKDNQHLLKTVTEQSVEIEKLRKQLRQAKLDMRVAVAKVEQLTKVTEDFQGEMQKKEEDMVSSQRREDASDRRLQQLQSSIKQLETRLCVTVQEATQLRADKTHLEKQTRELQAKYNELENERYEAVVTARNSMQLLEEANLQKNQALLEEKQKEEDIEKIKKSFSQLMQEAATRAKKEIFNTRKQYHVQISQLTEELSVLQMECAEKQGQIERVIKEKKAVEEELEKVYREGKVNENHYRKLEEMHQRCLVAECSKDDLQLRLKTAENKLKQLEINSSEEISRCQEMIQKLQNALESERENCGFVSEQRLKLQQENEQLQKETEDLRKMALEAQKKAKLKISAMEHEFSVKEHGFEVQLREMEDSNRNSTVELRHLLATQQKAANRWKEETKRATESAEMRISNLKSELSRQKLHTQELLSQLEMANEKVAESEKLILEHQEKANRLQRRLSQAEQRAASASQQLSVVTVQRRKAASMMNLENI